LESVPAEIRGFIDELNRDYNRMPEPGHAWCRILADDIIFLGFEVLADGPPAAAVP
jgi:hypothetical protein